MSLMNTETKQSSSIPIGEYRLDPEMVRKKKKDGFDFGTAFLILGSVVAFFDLKALVFAIAGPFIIFFINRGLNRRLEKDKLVIDDTQLSQSLDGDTMSFALGEIRSWREPMSSEVHSNQVDAFPGGLTVIDKSGREVQISPFFKGYENVCLWVKEAYPQTPHVLTEETKSALPKVIRTLRVFVGFITLSILLSAISSLEKGNYGTVLYLICVQTILVGFVEGLMLRCPACGKNFLKRKRLSLLTGLPNHCPECDVRIADKG